MSAVVTIKCDACGHTIYHGSTPLHTSQEFDRERGPQPVLRRWEHEPRRAIESTPPKGIAHGFVHASGTDGSLIYSKQTCSRECTFESTREVLLLIERLPLREDFVQAAINVSFSAARQ